MGARYNHWAYMRALAQRLKPLQGEGHYTECADFHALVSLLAQFNELRFPCLVADYDAAAAVVDRGSDNVLERTLYGCYLLCQGATPDEASVRAAMVQARELSTQVMLALMRDHRDAREGLQHLEVNSFRIEPLGAVGDSGYGVALSFTVLEPSTAVYNPNLWMP